MFRKLAGSRPPAIICGTQYCPIDYSHQLEQDDDNVQTPAGHRSIPEADSRASRALLETDPNNSSTKIEAVLHQCAIPNAISESERMEQNLEIKRSREDLSRMIASLSDRDRQIEKMQREMRDKEALITTLRSEISTKATAINTHINENKRLKDENSKLTKDKTELTRLGEENAKELARLNATYVKNANGDTELHLAVDRGDVKAVKDLVLRGACLDSRDNVNRTPLNRAGSLQDLTVGLEIIKFLIDQGADVYSRDKWNNTFLYHFTSTRTTPQQFHDITVYLITKNLSDLFTLEGQCSRTPLLFAVWAMKEDLWFDTLSLLRGKSIDFNKVDRQGNNLFSLSLVGNRTTTFLSKLIEFGVSWKHINIRGQSMVHLAAEGCNVGGLKLLLGKGMAINAVDAYGNTPLHRAALFGEGAILETVRFLISNGANTKLKDKSGNTPRDELHQNPYTIFDKDKVVQLLSK